MRRNLRIHSLILGFAALGGCDDDLENLGIFSLRSDDATRSWMVPDRVNQGGGPSQLASVANNVTEARYALGSQRTAYLFAGNLRNGLGAFIDWSLWVWTGTYQVLPAYDPSSPSIVLEDGVPWMVVDVAQPSWNSFRVYDSGECSLLLDFDDEQLPDLVPALAPLITRQIDEIFASCNRPETERFERVSTAVVSPILRARPSDGGLGTDDDMIRYLATYRAPSVGGCAPVNVDVSFDMGLRASPNGLTGVVENVSANVHGFCIAGGAIEQNIRDRITNAVPTAFPNAIRNRLLVNPAIFGLSSIPSCTQDSQCTSAWPWGSGHRCHGASPGSPGQCWIQVDASRANLRPEGLELVLFEDDDDPQRGLLSSDTPFGPALEEAACGTDRWSGILHPSNTVSGSISASTVSTASAVSPPDFCD